MVADAPVEVGVSGQVEASCKEGDKSDCEGDSGQLVVGLVGGLEGGQQGEGENPKGVCCQNEYCGSQLIVQRDESF